MENSIWYHGTTAKNVTDITKDGFKLNSEETGIWGTGIYLTDCPKDALGYGHTVLQVEVEEEAIFRIDYLDIQAVIPDLMVEEEAGDPAFEQYVVNERKMKAVAITYPESETHLIVYDLTAIKRVALTAEVQP